MYIIELTKRTVSQVTGVSMSELEGKTRYRNIVEARNICYAIIRNTSNLTLLKIAKYFGGRDHTTIIHGLKTHEDLMLVMGNQEYKFTYNKCLKMVENEIKVYEEEPVINPS